MAEEFEDAQKQESSGAPDPLAAQLALAASGLAPEEAREYLKRQSTVAEKQSRLLDLQIENMRDVDKYELSHLRWRRFNDQMRGALQIMLVLVGALIVLGIGALVWQAHEARGLVAEPFRTPADFAARGLDGTVLAQQLLDRLDALIDRSNAYNLRKPDNISGSWSGDIKVQIPSTGISIDELSHLLRERLGHETHVSGEVWRDGDRIALTVRDGTGFARTFEGKPSDLGLLMDKAADALLGQTQPFAYVSLLAQRNDAHGIIALSRQLILNGSASDRALAYTYWANALANLGEDRAAIHPYARGIALAPGDPMSSFFAVNADIALDHGEAFAEHAAMAARLFGTSAARIYRPEALANAIPSANSMLAQTQGDFANAARNDAIAAQYAFSDYENIGALVTVADLARDHDPAAARAILADHPDYTDGKAVVLLDFVGPQLPVSFIEADMGDWRGVLASLSSADRVALKSGTSNDARHTLIWPWLAYALAKTGNMARARALIAKTPLDCTRCLEYRGRIAALARDYPRAAYWYARAATDAPSEPFAMTDWGQMLLRDGKYDDAIAKFEAANKIGPHFADPLEMWGEALIRKNRSDLALAKFAQAAKYAPNWGRLHLKWGEALWWSGDHDGARKQFAVAAHLDLTPSEKTELTRVSHG